MPIYKCSDCDYNTKSKQSITRHKNNKYPCRNQVIEVNSISDITDNNNNDNTDIETDADNDADDKTRFLLSKLKRVKAENRLLKNTDNIVFH